MKSSERYVGSHRTISVRLISHTSVENIRRENVYGI